MITYIYAMPQSQRRQWIIERLGQGPVASQEELAAWLATHGQSVTQATISRDFQAIGVVKGPAGYALPGAVHAVSASGNGVELDTLLTRHAVAIDVADALVVIRTAPGHAGLLASALDRWPPKSTVGTIAGDDTIFVATASHTAASKLAMHLTQRAGLRRRSRRA